METFGRAAELGLSYEEFCIDNWAGFIWKWTGYVRNIERREWLTSREIISIIYNQNAKKGQGKSGVKLFPLSIDNIIEFTPEIADTRYKAAIAAGWFENDKSIN